MHQHPRVVADLVHASSDGIVALDDAGLSLFSAGTDETFRE
jgi:hypothetical protein